MARCVDSHECQVAAALDFTSLLAVSTKLEIGTANFAICFASVPFQCIGPYVISKPIADEVSISLICWSAHVSPLQRSVMYSID